MFSLRRLLIAITLVVGAARAAAITLTLFNTSFTEDFDSLATATSSVVPPGWSFNETGSGADTTYGAGTGSSATGNTYSFGASASTDRAFGTLRTSSLGSTLGTVITNQTGDVIDQLVIQYTGEQWRLGATGRVDRLDFSYSLDATSLVTGSWVDVPALNFTAPITSGATGALDGNAAANRVTLSSTLSGLNLPSGSSLWLRWNDLDAVGSDDGLGIDNFSISAVQASSSAVPDPLPAGTIAALLASLLAAARAVRRTAQS